MVRANDPPPESVPENKLLPNGRFNPIDMFNAGFL